MIRKSEQRFSEKIMLNQRTKEATKADLPLLVCPRKVNLGRIGRRASRTH